MQKNRESGERENVPKNLARSREDFLRLVGLFWLKQRALRFLRLCARRKVFIFSREIHIKKTFPQISPRERHAFIFKKFRV